MAEIIDLLRYRAEPEMWKDRLYQVIVVGRTVFRWSWIPFIIYLGKEKPIVSNCQGQHHIKTPLWCTCGVGETYEGKG